MGKVLKSEDEIRSNKINILETIFGDHSLHSKLNNHTVTDRMIGFIENGTNGPGALMILQQPQSTKNLQKLITAAGEFQKISPYKSK